MENKTLEQIYANHDGKISDKWSIYLAEYELIFNKHRNRDIRLLEIGIQNGGSLEIWSKYFPHARKLVGVDINPDCGDLNYEDPRIAVVVGDANSDAVQAKVLEYEQGFDVIIDDGSHRSSDLVRSFARYFPYLVDGGVFIAEDLHCSYWQEFEGGLFDPFSSITFFKRLADVVSYEHWGIEKARADILSGFFSKYDFQIDEEALQHVHSVEFSNSMCVIRKEKPMRNRLGKRIIAGSAGIIGSKQEIESSLVLPLNQISNKWTVRSVPPDEELLLRIQELAEAEEQITSLKQGIMDRDRAIAGILNSNSWRITGPLRRLRNINVTTFRIFMQVIGTFLRYPSLLPFKQFREYIFIRKNPLFDKDFYLKNNQDLYRYGIDPAWHFIIHGATERRNPNPFFDTSFYLKTYPEVSVSKVNPLFHYLRYGVANCEKNNIEGAFSELNLSKETVMVVSHEASLTGAPILSLNIVQWLIKKYNVVVILLGAGIIKNEFRKAGAIVVGPPILQYDLPAYAFLIEFVLKNCKLKFTIVNSIESRMVLTTLSKNFIPTISLIHEFPAYIRPKEAILDAIHLSGKTIFSSRLTQQGALSAYPLLWDSPESIDYILPQGRCKVPALELNSQAIADEEHKIQNILRLQTVCTKPIIVLGVGSVNLRKGVDLFIECASRVIKNAKNITYRFLWIGAGYNPETDIGYSVYLEDQIKRAGLQEHLFILDQIRNIEGAYKMADILLLSSRLDPLPNVAIDAMSHALPVVCFENATGIADILIANGLGEYCVAPYLDTTALAEKITMLGGSDKFRHQVGLRLQHVALQEFDMNRYMENLEKIALNVETRIKQEKIDVDYLFNSSMFREDFYISPTNPRRSRIDSIRSYVRSWASGIRRRKPIPGFHPGIYYEQHGVAITGRDPFADYLDCESPIGPWCCEVISSKDKMHTIPENIHIALHLHVYYPDLLAEMIISLQKNKLRPDIFISVPTRATKETVLSHMKSYGENIEVQVVPNRGRDIGPFITQFGHSFLKNYDFIGHLHTKKSENLNNIDFVNQWRYFLLKNLIGVETNMADIILGRMATDDSIGLVFPDDPHVVSWGKNKLIADELAKRLSIDNLPIYFNFPIGTMFWARTEALRSLFELGFQWEDYPEEPLPYDGSLVHALERMLPFIVSQNGFRSVVTNIYGVTRS